MSYRTVFDDAVSAEVGPPSTVDIDAIVRREKRRTRRWQLTAAAAAAALAVGVPFAVGTLDDRSPDTAGVGTPPSAVPEPGDTTQAATPAVDPAQRNAAVAAKLSAALEAKLRAMLPGTTFVDTAVNGDVATGPFQIAPYADPDVPPTARIVNSFAVAPDLRDAKGTGNLNLLIGKMVQPPTGGKPVPTDRGIGQFMACPPEFGPSCQVRTGPAGETIVVVVPYFVDENGSKITRVDVSKPDGTGIVFECRNWGEATAAGKISAPRRSVPPLDVDQLIELALDPGLVVDQ